MAAVNTGAEDVTQNARRVSQLDASELDNQIFELIKSQLGKTFKYFKPHVLMKYGPEIHAALRLLLWKFTVNSLEATVGQQLLDLRYSDATAPATRGSQWMSWRQKLLYAACFCGAPYLHDRLADLQAITRNVRYAEKIWSAVKWATVSLKVAGLANFLIFLVRGEYQFVFERLLGVRAVYPRPTGVRQVGFEYMYREMLWHGFAEFLFFLLPMINFRRIKNFLSRQFLAKSSSKQSSSERVEADYKECAVCGVWPTHPHEIGCQHVFCYYCIQSNYLSDPGYTCPVCGQGVSAPDAIQPVSIKHTITPPS